MNANNVMDNLQHRTRESYLAYRLNQPELVEVTEKLKAGKLDEAAQALDQFTKVSTDWRGKPASGDLASATQFLGLDKQFKELSQDMVWTPYQRALYRRMSTPEFDPSPPTAAETTHGNPDLVKYAKAIFSRVDADNDGHLSPVKLDKAMAEANFEGAEAAAVVALRRNGPQLATCVEDGEGVTVADLEHFLANGIPHDSKITAKLNRGFKVLVERAERIKNKPAGPIEQENFDPYEVMQGKAGSCVMLSTDAGVPATSLKEMFHDNHDGTIRVTFKDKDVETVRDLTLAERLYHAHASEEGRWPGVLEMAMGQRLYHADPSDDHSVRTRVNSQPVETTIPALGGIPCKRYNIDKMTPNQLRSTLIELDKLGGPKVCGTRSAPKGDDSDISVEELHNGIANNHAYTYRNFDKAADVVNERNPWHKGEWIIHSDGKDDGLFGIPLLEYYSSYRWIAGPPIKQNPPSK